MAKGTVGHSTTTYLKDILPEVGKSFYDLRHAIEKAGPLDKATFELILMSAMAVSGLELPFKNHALAAKKSGIKKEALRQAAIIPMAATATTFAVITALHWVDEIYDDPSL